MFDFTFHHGISYDTLQTNISPESPITWTTSADATIVANAIATAVNAFGDVTGTRTDEILVPHIEPGTTVTYVEGNNNETTTNYSGWFDSIQFANSNQSTVFALDDAWVTATTAVPEPTSFGIAMLGLARRRRLS